MTAFLPKTHAEETLASQFAATLPRLPGDAARRTAAFTQFAALGLPHRRIEAWHYTDWQRLTVDALAPLAASAVVPKPVAGVEAVSTAKGVAAGHALTQHIGAVLPDAIDPLIALNAALFSDGMLCRIASGARIAAPVMLHETLGADGPAAVTRRSVIVIENDAEVTLVGGFSSPDGVGLQLSSVVEVIVGDNAKVEFITTNGLGDQAQAFQVMGVQLGRNATFNTLHFASGGAVSRHQVHINAAGEGAKFGVRGVSLLKGRQHSDATLVVDHIAPNCESRELFRAVIDGEATGVFQGKITVRKDAQKTDGRMASNTVLLSEGATMNNKPELEIFADDVQCAHGATCGELDDDLLFYLQARGLPRAEAEALMLQAFLGEVLEHVTDEDLRATLNGQVEAWLKARAG